jgi:hypothetical protein
MFARRTFCWLTLALFEVFVVGLITGQSPAPAQQAPRPTQAPQSAAAHISLTPDGFVDSAIRQEGSLADLLRYFRPNIETYIQEQRPDSDLTSAPKSDEYFLSRLDLTGSAPVTSAFADPEGLKPAWRKKLLKDEQPFTADGFAQPMFPDLGHFDRQNYTFEFVRWEVLGEVRCGVFDVKPRENSTNHGFTGRIWVEDQAFNIVRFTGAYAAKPISSRTFHFDSWRLNTLGDMWMPAYIYTEEANPHDPSSRVPWFKAQTRIWGYDLQHAGDHREFAKPLTDNPMWVDPNRHEASQNLNPAYTLGKSAYTPEDDVVERLQVAGLMAPDGDVDQALQTVVNNLLITNNLDIAGVRCRVLLTTPLESFVVGRTIVLSRGLLDVLPDEATLAAVLGHELGHIVLRHSVRDDKYLMDLLPFSDLEILAHFDFRFDSEKEAGADKKGQELLSNSPYRGEIAKAALFLEALKARAPQLPNLLHGRFSNDFASSHLVAMKALATSPKHLQMDRLDQIAALPLGSRMGVDPWSDRIEMLKRKPVRLETKSEKMPFEVSPFFPYLKRLNEPEKAPGKTHP